jgi:hypothetical protein
MVRRTAKPLQTQIAVHPDFALSRRGQFHQTNGNHSGIFGAGGAKS